MIAKAEASKISWDKNMHTEEEKEREQEKMVT